MPEETARSISRRSSLTGNGKSRLRNLLTRQRSGVFYLGDWSAVRIGAPSPLSDLYYFVMEMNWPIFIALVCVIFAGINIGFGLIYASIPGAIANAVPGSIADGIFFSIDTLGTVGYGFMYPTTHLAHAVASIEILLGIFFSATITGLVFARFARPRLSLLFSPIAVIGRYDDRLALMIRAATVRNHPLADATAQLSWLQTIQVPGGGTIRQLAELELLRSRNTMFGLTWTLVHVLEEESPLIAALTGDGRFMLSVTVTGTDTLLANQSLAGYRYTREDIRIDHEFMDMVSEDQGTVYVDLDKIGATRPIMTG